MHLYIVLNNGKTIDKYVTGVEFDGNALRFYEVISENEIYTETAGPTYVYADKIKSFYIIDH